MRCFCFQLEVAIDLQMYRKLLLNFKPEFPINKFKQTFCKLFGCRTYIWNFEKARLSIHRCFRFLEYDGMKAQEICTIFYQRTVEGNC